MPKPQPIPSIRGMHTLLPKECSRWRAVEDSLRHIVAQYGYQEIRFPLVEQTTLFKRSVGEVTDIVSKEMYTFTDRNGDSISLRPEGTASCVRAAIEHGLLYNQIQRLYYLGPMFRHERPQAGRTRQFHQLGVEAYGMPGPCIDIELIALCYQIWTTLQLETVVTLELNHLGDVHTRTQYRQRLIDYFSPHLDQLDAAHQIRLQRNPLRLLDSKDPTLSTLIANAPSIIDSLSTSERHELDTVKSQLSALNIPFTLKPNLVRGLDYYDGIVYEWTSTQLGAQSTVCAGGRYDRLVEALGGQPCPAAGFALGLERLMLLISNQSLAHSNPFIYLISTDEDAQQAQTLLANQIRHHFSDIIVVQDAKGGPLKRQLKRADQLNAQFAWIRAEQELKDETICIKPLQSDAAQFHIDANQALACIADTLTHA